MRLRGVLVGLLLLLCSILLVLVTLYYSTSSNEEFLAFLKVYITVINLVIAFIIAWVGVSTIVVSREPRDTP